MKARAIEVERAKAGCGVELPRVHRALALFYVLLALFNGTSLLRQAELMRYGGRRDVCVALARPLAALSHATGLDRPRMWVERLTGNEDEAAQDGGEVR